MWNFKSLQKHFVLLFLFCAIPFGMSFAQSTIKGTVNDETGEPVIGASVKVQGTNEGAITDLDGNFTVKASSDATLAISYVGYVTQTVKVGGKTNITVTLVEDNTTLNDVVVIG